MATRRLEIDVIVDDGGAVRTLGKVEAGVRGVERSADAAGGSVTKFSAAIFAATTAGTVLGNLLQRGMSAAFRQATQTMGEAITQAQAFENAMIGLSTIAGRFGVPVDQATAAAQRLASDGLLGVADAAAGLKNLLVSGFGLNEAIRLMEGFKDSAAFNRQASLGFGAAVVSATEGIKNQNSILVDNAGLTKNLSVIMKEAGLSVNDLASVSSDAAIRAKFLGGLLEELGIFAGDAAKLTDNYSGATTRLGTVWRDTVLPALGRAVTENEAVIEVVKQGADALTEFAEELDVDKMKSFVTDGLEVLKFTFEGVMVVVGAAATVFRGINAVMQLNKEATLSLIGVWTTATDAVIGTAREMSDGIREWLLDRFTAIVDAVRAKVDAVTGFFRDMKDKVVGNSFVPDMIDGIESEFARLDSVMVAPARLAADQINGIFMGLANTVPQRFRGLMNEVMGASGGAGDDGFFSTVFGDSLGGLNSIFQRAFEGGGGLGGAIQSFATDALSKALNFVPIVGPILSQFAGAFVSGFKKLFGGVGGFFKDLFGGPSSAELAGRDTANAWIDSVISTTNISSDRISAAVAEGWDPRLAEFALSAQDVWTAAGSTAEAAMSWTQKFFDAIKQGPGAVQPLIDEFQRMQNSAEDVSSAVDDIFRPRSLDYTITGDNRQFVNVISGDVGDATRVGVGTGGTRSRHSGGMVQGFASGGLVDDVPAMLQRGEFVMRRGAVDRIGAGRLAQMNAAGGGGSVNVNVKIDGMFMDSPNSRRKLAQTLAGEFRKTLAVTGRVGF